MGFNNNAQRSTPPYYLDVDNPFHLKNMSRIVTELTKFRCLMLVENISTNVTAPTKSMCYPCVCLLTKLFKKCSPHLSHCNFKCSYVMEERLLQNQPNFYDYPCANDMKGIVCFLITKLVQKCFSHNSHCNFKLINSMQESFSRKFFLECFSDSFS